MHQRVSGSFTLVSVHISSFFSMKVLCVSTVISTEWLAVSGVPKVGVLGKDVSIS